ncbi:MAG TPA: hypothetical protein VNX70_01685 [Bryobacteraceae bacterium]|jgi:hypothetical protein|nr:hypothetical protein [Bryobacteraceae bacterium]
MWKKAVIWGTAVLVVAIALTLVIRKRLQKSAVIQGAVLMQDADPRRQLPIPGVDVTAEVGELRVQNKSDASGLFRLTVPRALWRSESADLRFRHPSYQSVYITQPLTDQIFVIRMVAVAAKAAPELSAPQATLKDVRVRYATKATTPINVGSIAKTFEVMNVGDLPCDGASPCSPDGKWKAAIGGFTLDAGEGHEYRNARASCIAGPCPFAKIESDQFSGGGRVIKVSVRNWSDIVTFLVEAEVIQTIPSDSIRNAYPIIFGREMSFTLPPAAQGPSIEADINGDEIVFPLGPALTLPWAHCNLQVGTDRTKLYRCELKPEYRFQ